MDSGKRFERSFHMSLKLLPGASMRIEDGGGKAKNQQWGDFFYWDYEGNDILVECKATKEDAFPHRNLADRQLERLLQWEKISPRKISYLAINYYQENIRLHNECVLIPISNYVDWLDETKRASLPYEVALRIGELQPQIRIPNGDKTIPGWALVFRV